MAFFENPPSPPPAPARKNKINRLKDDVDEFLSSDLELSFASTMSLNSPSGSRATSPVLMDISPAQPLHSREHLVPPTTRFFGRELLNTEPPHSITKPSDTKSSSRGRQRSAIPAQWLMVGSNSTKEEQHPKTLNVPNNNHTVSSPDAMDVDVICSPSPGPPQLVTGEFSSPVPLCTNANYANLFFEGSSPEPRQAHAPKKRRSSSPELSQRIISPDPPSSPSQTKFTRAATIGAGAAMFKKPSLEYSAPSTKQFPLRRPALSALVAPTQRSQSQNVESEIGPRTAPLLPARRAFSAMVPPTTGEPSSDDVSDINSSSPAAAYAKRHQARVIRRCDGSDELRPLAGAGSLGKRDREELQDGGRAHGCSPRGMAGFGVKEIEKKILPCHRVSEDGLVRITSNTLKGLLCGGYSSKVTDFTIVDCRFEYEYEGGHIPGAVNLNTTTAIEEYFLGGNKPNPCESGDSVATSVLVFHCEFSVKRAPTFAKHLRSKDRTMNGRVYPKVCYPEIYILEGGFCQFFKEFPSHCDPQGYVRMDDPAYTRARDADLDNFRRGKWIRTHSYTYGQTASDVSSAPSFTSGTAPREHRNTAPSGGPGGSGSMFAAANIARGRRAGAVASKVLTTLDEDASSSGHEDGDNGDVQDSPCPPPSKTLSRQGVLGKSRNGRAGLDRTASHGSTISTRH